MLLKEDVLPPILSLLESQNVDHKYLRQLCEETRNIVQQFLNEEIELHIKLEKIVKFEFQSISELRRDLLYINALKSVLKLSYTIFDGNKKLLPTLYTLTSLTDESPKTCELFLLDNGMDLCLNVLKVWFLF